MNHEEIVTFMAELGFTYSESSDTHTMFRYEPILSTSLDWTGKDFTIKIIKDYEWTKELLFIKIANSIFSSGMYYKRDKILEAFTKIIY